MPAARPSEAGWAPPAWRGVRAGPEALGWGAGGSAAPLLLSQMCSCRRRWEQEKPLHLNSVSCSAGVAEFPGVKCILLLLKPRSGSPQWSPFYLLQSSLLKGCATVALLGYTKKTNRPSSRGFSHWGKRWNTLGGQKPFCLFLHPQKYSFCMGYPGSTAGPPLAFKQDLQL